MCLHSVLLEFKDHCVVVGSQALIVEVHVFGPLTRESVLLIMSWEEGA